MTDIKKETIKLINAVIPIKELAADYSVHLEDLNKLFELDEFDVSAIQVVADCGFDGVVYQVSNTHDGGAISRKLSINGESGSYGAMEASLLARGLDREFVDEYVLDIAELLGEELGVQKIFDDYVKEFGRWKPYPNAMDGDSEIFVKKHKPRLP